MNNQTVIGRSILYNMDCMTLLKATPDKFYELAIIDPPYGIGFDKKIREKSTKQWDSEIPSNLYFDEIKRVSKNQIIWGANYFPSLWLNGCRGFIFWNKDVNFYTYSAGELAYTSFKAPAKYFYYAWNGLADGVRGKNKIEQTIHPTQKPIKLYEWLLTNYAKTGDKILDTHGGSMSSVIACLNMGFDITCCELDSDYFKAGVARVEQSQKQQRMFA